MNKIKTLKNDKYGIRGVTTRGSLLGQYPRKSRKSLEEVRKSEVFSRKSKGILEEVQEVLEKFRGSPRKFVEARESPRNS